jgi:hypothetical protein
VEIILHRGQHFCFAAITIDPTATISLSQHRSDYLHGGIVVARPQETSSPSRVIVRIAPHGSHLASFIGLVSDPHWPLPSMASCHTILPEWAFIVGWAMAPSQWPTRHVRRQPQLRGMQLPGREGLGSRTWVVARSEESPWSCCFGRLSCLLIFLFLLAAMTWKEDRID